MDILHLLKIYKSYDNCIFLCHLNCKKKDNKILAVERAFCIMTRHEFFEVFCFALHFLKNTLKYQRLTIAGEKAEYDNHAARVQNDLEASTKLPYITEDGLYMLRQLYEQEVALKKEIILSSLNEVQDEYTFKVPDFEELRKSVAHFFCPMLFNALSLESFYKMISCIFLEKSILFISENLNLLSSAVYFFIYGRL